MPDDPSSIDRAAVAAAVAALDRDAIAAARWFGAKGRTIRGIGLDEAFVLDDDAGHVLAIATLTLDDGATERYSMALTGQPLREAVPGDGAWRALAVAMAEGRTIASLAEGRQRHRRPPDPGPRDRGPRLSTGRGHATGRRPGHGTGSRRGPEQHQRGHRRRTSCSRRTAASSPA